MRTVIIGLGTVSRTHRKALALMDDVELVAVADVKPEKEEDCRKVFISTKIIKKCWTKKNRMKLISAFHIISIWKQLQSVQREE